MDIAQFITKSNKCKTLEGKTLESVLDPRGKTLKSVLDPRGKKRADNVYHYRPTFIDEQTGGEIKAGGALFYHKNKLLMIYSRNNYEDFGGKTSLEDNSIEMTIAREVEEESNNIISRDFVLSKIQDEKNDIDRYYIPQSKYLVYLIELDNFIDVELFGDLEITDNIKRNVEWIDAGDFFKVARSFRLNNKSLFSRIKNIVDTNKNLDKMTNQYIDIDKELKSEIDIYYENMKIMKYVNKTKYLHKYAKQRYNYLRKPNNVKYVC